MQFLGRTCRALALPVAMVPLAVACVGSGEVLPSVSGQIVGNDERPLGPGLVLIERGHVHEGTYETGALIVDEGRFSSDLGGGGFWGLHLFHDDYSYLPLEIEITEHQQVVLTSLNVAWGQWMDLTGQPTWPDQPADATRIRLPSDDNFNDNPIIHDIGLNYLSDEFLEITMDVSDPDGDLSRMILVYDIDTGGGFKLNEPTPPDAQGNYPDGVYKVVVPVDERHVPGVSELRFVVSDNLCNNSPILTRTWPLR